MKTKSKPHIVTRIVRDDGTTCGYKCSCGGWWKVYQKEYHQTDSAVSRAEDEVALAYAYREETP